MSNLQPITLDAIEETVKQAGHPVLIDVWAPWCGYCMRNMPIVEKVADDVADRASVYALNVDENPGAREHFGIQSIPSYVLYAADGSHEVIRGSQSRKALTQAIDGVV